jgi:hypothetical protein
LLHCRNKNSMSIIPYCESYYLYNSIITRLRM